MADIGIVIGRGLVVAGIALMFVAYLNFVPTSLSNDRIADYVKNHFVREVVFGIALAVYSIMTALGPITAESWTTLAVVGSIVVLPFWIAVLSGWSTGGMEEVWGEKIRVRTAYLLHGLQVAMFYSGLGLLGISMQ